jgi:LPXTG-motif cell wall-anchored protein
MNGALLFTLNGFSSFLWADGDLVIELTGTNVLTYSGSAYTSIFGLGCDGTLTIRDGSGLGTGQLTISITNSDFHYEVHGISAGGGIVMESGRLGVILYHPTRAFALQAVTGISIQGGQTSLIISSPTAYAMDCSVFSLSGGIVQTTVNGMGSDSCALRFNSAQFSGGYGLFSTVEAGVGAIWNQPDTGTFTYSGGQVIFSGGDGALTFITSNIITPAVTGYIFVSEYPSGLDPVLWDATMDPLANRTLYVSPYTYVALFPAAQLPHTGDTGTPWLWAGIAGLAVLIAAGAYLFIRRKRK